MSNLGIMKGLCLWMCLVTCFYPVSPDCLTGQLTLGRGLATSNDNHRASLGCTNACPITGPEIHVIAQFAANPKFDREVFITIHNSCYDPVDVVLVLISQEAISWRLHLEDTNYLDARGNVINVKVNIKQILVYQVQGSTSKSSVEGFHWTEQGEASVDMPKGFTNATALILLKRWITETFETVTSINFGIRPRRWELETKHECCPDPHTGFQVPAVNFPTPYTRTTAAPQSDSQGNRKDPQAIAIVVVVAILTVILISLIIIGALWYYRFQKKNAKLNDHQEQGTGNRGLSSLAGGAAAHVEHNVYDVSPTADKSESQGITQEQ